jgi:hypothetical protein
MIEGLIVRLVGVGVTAWVLWSVKSGPDRAMDGKEPMLFLLVLLTFCWACRDLFSTSSRFTWRTISHPGGQVRRDQLLYVLSRLTAPAALVILGLSFSVLYGRHYVLSGVVCTECNFTGGWTVTVQVVRAAGAKKLRQPDGGGSVLPQ